ncbi:MAG: hypothetical protein KKB34_10320 [Bacteroidetes bacterium]|nr:hypothetical protein [Bacteroidota bacterium]
MDKIKYVIKFANGRYLGKYGQVRIKQYARIFTEHEAVKKQTNLKQLKEIVTLETLEEVTPC